MDYSKLSDFEINCLVAEATGHSPLDAEHGYAGLQAEGDITAAIVRGPRKIGAFDPCNNPADAWPIIVENNMSLHAPRYKEGWMAEFTGSDDDVNDGFSVEYLESHHENPLRAAMIVFLMMQDSANVPANSTGSDIR
ncbi:DUF2591 domain-containing protein [Citrobacter freundii]|nr:DUF2591 domain-containing protein [Citrobacter freundii]